jgi:hypothetical protein
MTTGHLHSYLDTLYTASQNFLEARIITFARSVV